MDSDCTSWFLAYPLPSMGQITFKTGQKIDLTDHYRKAFHRAAMVLAGQIVDDQKQTKDPKKKKARKKSAAKSFFMSLIRSCAYDVYSLRNPDPETNPYARQAYANKHLVFRLRDIGGPTDHDVFPLGFPVRIAHPHHRISLPVDQGTGEPVFPQARHYKIIVNLPSFTILQADGKAETHCRAAGGVNADQAPNTKGVTKKKRSLTNGNLNRASQIPTKQNTDASKSLKGTWRPRPDRLRRGVAPQHL